MLGRDRVREREPLVVAVVEDVQVTDPDELLPADREGSSELLVAVVELSNSPIRQRTRASSGPEPCSLQVSGAALHPFWDRLALRPEGTFTACPDGLASCGKASKPDRLIYISHMHGEPHGTFYKQVCRSGI